MAVKKIYKFPKTPGACADHLWNLKEAISKLNAQVKVLDDEQSALKNHIIETLPKSDMTGASGKLATVKVETKEVYNVTDKVTLMAWAVKHKAQDIFQSRLSPEAVSSRWDAKKPIPGIGTFQAVVIRLNKVK